MKKEKIFFIILILSAIAVLFINSTVFAAEENTKYPAKYLSEATTMPKNIDFYAQFELCGDAEDGQLNVALKNDNLKAIIDTLNEDKFIYKEDNEEIFNKLETYSNGKMVLYLGVIIDKPEDMAKIELYDGDFLLNNMDFSYCKENEETGSYELFLEIAFKASSNEWSYGTGLYYLNIPLEVRCYRNETDTEPTEIKYFTINPVENVQKMAFNDVAENGWYYGAVKYVYTNNIIKGMNDTTFAPNENLTRAMLVTILHRMEGSPYVSGLSKFPDVQNTNEYYYVAVKWATQNNIVSGYNNGNFGPNDPITREQLAVILNKYCNYKGKYKAQVADLTKFKDANNISDWAKWGMNWAVGAGVITGNDKDKTLNPQGTATRAEVASMLYKYCLNVK